VDLNGLEKDVCFVQQLPVGQKQFMNSHTGCELTPTHAAERERERERERQRVSVRERESERERETVHAAPGGEARFHNLSNTTATRQQAR
jgi:hypothetical protein